mmetsp:Transcript_8566/g.18457  ORF Transcript_8566/g.18457 Transcript_8566/m.18457 type:complete len:130 (+) Transcript_8566:1358-1747(+)
MVASAFEPGRTTAVVGYPLRRDSRTTAFPMYPVAPTTAIFSPEHDTPGVGGTVSVSVSATNNIVAEFVEEEDVPLRTTDGDGSLATKADAVPTTKNTSKINCNRNRIILVLTLVAAATLTWPLLRKSMA